MLLVLIRMSIQGVMAVRVMLQDIMHIFVVVLNSYTQSVWECGYVICDLVVACLRFKITWSSYTSLQLWQGVNLFEFYKHCVTCDVICVHSCNLASIL